MLPPPTWMTSAPTHDVGEVVEVAVEQLEVAGTAPPGVEGLVERDDVAGVVPGRGGQEEHHGVVLAGELQDVVVQRVVAAVHDRPSGAHGDDVSGHARTSWMLVGYVSVAGGANRTILINVGVTSSSRCIADPIHHGVALHPAVTGREQLHEGQSGLRELVGVRFEDVAARDRLVRLRVRDDHREVLLGVGGSQPETGYTGRPVVGDRDGLGRPRRTGPGTGATSKSSSLSDSTRTSSVRRLAQPALDGPLVAGCRLGRHADRLGGEDDPGSGRRDVELPLEAGPLEGRDPLDAARPDREELHHCQAGFAEPVGIGPQDVAAGDLVVAVGLGDHHREPLVGVDRRDAEAGESRGAVLAEGDRLAVLARQRRRARCRWRPRRPRARP